MYLNDEYGDFFCSRPETEAERRLYGYVEHIARDTQDPSRGIEQFILLLHHANASSNHQQIRSAMEEIVGAGGLKYRVEYVINRLHHTIGNIW
ncbi:hypothetical protein, partial [Sphaerothrix gracilis]|uniref:hypothetical protein n=1 Tax=Sphaerothrix gracilis TaxID=3151835 RepID=UPI0031FCCB7C